MRLNVFLNSYGTRREVGLLSEENGRIFFERQFLRGSMGKRRQQMPNGKR